MMGFLGFLGFLIIAGFIFGAGKRRKRKRAVENTDTVFDTEPDAESDDPGTALAVIDKDKDAGETIHFIIKRLSLCVGNLDESYRPAKIGEIKTPVTFVSIILLAKHPLGDILESSMAFEWADEVGAPVGIRSDVASRARLHDPITLEVRVPITDQVLAAWLSSRMNIDHSVTTLVSYAIKTSKTVYADDDVKVKLKWKSTLAPDDAAQFMAR